MDLSKNLGKILLAAATFYYGWQLYTIPAMSAEAGQRVLMNWSYIKEAHPSFQEYDQIVVDNVVIMVKVMMYML